MNQSVRLYTAKEIVEEFQDGEVAVLMNCNSEQTKETWGNSLKSIRLSSSGKEEKLLVSVETSELLYCGTENEKNENLFSYLDALWWKHGEEIKWTEAGVAILSEQPFRVRWIDKEKKEAFYTQHFSEKEHELYQDISEWCIDILGPEPDYVLEKEFQLAYRERNHSRLMKCIEKYDPERYKQMHLPNITGFCFETNFLGQQDYVPEFKESICAFLDEQVDLLRPSIERIIEQQLKPLYQVYKNEKG